MQSSESVNVKWKAIYGREQLAIKRSDTRVEIYQCRLFSRILGSTFLSDANPVNGWHPMLDVADPNYEVKLKECVGAVDTSRNMTFKEFLKEYEGVSD